MYCLVKQAMLLLLLLAVTNYSPSQAADDCEGVNTLLPAKDLHKIFGEWVVVYSVSDYQLGWDVLPQLASSSMKFRLLDNKTVLYEETYMYHNNSCTQYATNMSMPSDPTSDEHHPLVYLYGTLQKDGEVAKHYNDSGEIDVYVSCPDCLTFVYRDLDGRFVFFCMREGHHKDVEQLKAAHDGFRKKAECMNIPLDKPFVYDGLTGTCKVKPPAEVKQEEEAS